MVTDQTQRGYQWLIFIEVQRIIFLSLFSFLHSIWAILHKFAVFPWMRSEVLCLCQDLGILIFHIEKSEVCRKQKACWQQCGIAQKQKPVSHNDNGVTRDKLVTLPTLDKYF